MALCDNCDAQHGGKRCSRCKVAHYCSRECQKAHWPQHKGQCKIFASCATTKMSAQTNVSLSNTGNTTVVSMVTTGVDRHSDSAARMEFVKNLVEKVLPEKAEAS